MRMTHLNWPLEVLSRAVHFKNLSAASSQVGLSQPQLSRLIAKLEDELGLSLLDRQVKRQSAWTKEALKLAEMYHASQVRLTEAIHQLQQSGKMRQVRFGSLEGLLGEALKISKRLFEYGVQEVHVDVFDQNELEARFLSGDLDLVLNSRTPGRAKWRHSKICGYQTLDKVERSTKFHVLSNTEFARTRRHKADNKLFVSNSLLARQLWLREYGGVGSLPSEVQTRAKQGLVPVMLIGTEALPADIWQAILD